MDVSRDVESPPIGRQAGSARCRTVSAVGELYLDWEYRITSVQLVVAMLAMGAGIVAIHRGTSPITPGLPHTYQDVAPTPAKAPS